MQPLPHDPDDYASAIAPDGTRVALTMTCVANAAGTVPAGDYSAGDGRLVGALLAGALGVAPQAAAQAVQQAGCAAAVETIEQLLADYALHRAHVTLIGGGGGAGAVTPCTGELLHLPWRIAENAPVISAIGVALALVRDTVERTIPNPTQDDLLRVRREAVEAVVRVGANPDTVEVQVEVDPQQQIVRATATGASELRARELSGPAVADAARREAAARSLGVVPEEVREVARTPHLLALGCTRQTKKLFGLLKTRKTPLRVVDREGVIRLQLAHGEAAVQPAGQAAARLRALITAQAHYDDGGERLPAVFLLAGPRIFNLSGLLTTDHILSLAEAELQQLPPEEPVLLVVGERG